MVEREGAALGSREVIEQLRRVMAHSDKLLCKRCLRKAKGLLRRLPMGIMTAATDTLLDRFER